MSTSGSLGRGGGGGGGKGRVDITQILISTVEINARFWPLINARDSVQLGSRSPVHPHRWIRASSQDIAPSFLPFPPFLFLPRLLPLRA